MREASELRVSLGRLAEHFEREVQTYNGNGKGWGQFLDAPKTHTQIGPYGTCAGIIVLTLAGRGESSVCREAARLIHHWWSDRAEEMYSRKRFVQTLRLAFLVLAARISAVPELLAVSQEVEDSLLSHSLESGGWGDWWLNGDDYDPTPSVFTSSVVLLSLILFRSRPLSGIHSPRISRAVEFLERSIRTKSRLSDLELAGAVAALSAWRSLPKVTGKGGVPPLGSRSLPEQRHGIYFFFYEYVPDQEGKSFGRDYLLVPLELLVALGGLQPTAKASQRLIADEIVARVLETLDTNGGLYRVARKDHISSIDQAWVAIVLAAAASIEESGARPPGVLSRAWHGLAKRREDNIVTEVIIPLFVLAFFTIINASPWVDSSPVVKVAISVGTTVTAALYGENILRRLFRGKE